MTSTMRTPAVIPVYCIGLLTLLSWSTPVFSETATFVIIPEKTDKPREGDSVTMDCRVTLNKPPDMIFWMKSSATSGNGTRFVDESGLNSNADGRYSLGPITLVNVTGSVYSQRVTINSIRESDEALYTCLALTSQDMMQVASNAEMLEVYPVDEFPVCSPSGQATVINGGILSCGTLKDSKIPDVRLPGMPVGLSDWTVRESKSEQSGGTELTHTVNTSDDGTVFTCFAFSNDSSMAFSCKIGPLTVITSDLAVGLSSADIAGIAIGVILLVIIIALHFLCCCCTPRRWMRAKSYLLDTGSSYFGASKRQDRLESDQPISLELGNPQPDNKDVPPSSKYAKENVTEETSKLSVENEQDLSVTTKPKEVTSDKLEVGNSEEDVILKIPVSDTSNCTKNNPIYDNAKVSPVVQDNDNGSKSRLLPKKIRRFAVNRKGKVDKTAISDVVCVTTDGSKPKQDPSEINAKINEKENCSLIAEDDDENLPADNKSQTAISGLATDTTDGNELNQGRPVIYAKVDRMKTGSKISEDATGNSEAGKKSKKIKRFALNRKGKVDRAASPPKPEPVLMYAELDLPENEGSVQPPKDPQTLYAQIKH